MWNQLLCLCVNSQFGIDTIEQIRLFKKCGFDGFFVEYERGMDLTAIKNVADEIGMIFQSIHAPYVKMNSLWQHDDRTDDAIEELLNCVEDAKKVDVPIVVMHAFIGFEDHTPTEYGLQNIAKIVDRATELNIKLAFENTEGEEYLKAIMDRFKNNKNVGFCWDTGHEMCYNHSQDLMSLYGDRLFCTHLNDNLGISSYDGKITFLDDLHLLPFDGIADWNGIAERLNKYGFNDILTFELNTASKPGRHDNDIYNNMDINIYISEAYKRACRFAVLKQRLKG